jgi:LemA protein
LAISKGAWVVIVFLAIIVIIVAIGVSKYNSLARMEVAIDEKWAEIDNHLKRRSDLIPNLVETVKGYASHEKELFENIADARARLAGAATVGETMGAANQLGGFLGRLLAIAENYPQLKANENFLKLQDELAGTENRIATARSRYNQAVRNFNTAIRVFPSNIIAGFVGYEKKEFFEVPETDKELPEVKFD